MNNRRLAVLLVIAVCLAVLVWADRNSNTDSAADPLPVRPTDLQQTSDPLKSSKQRRETEPATRNPLASLQLKTLTETIERPLFSSSRRPPTKVATPVKRRPPPPRKQTKRNTFRLLGVVGGGLHRIALLKDQRDGRHFRVEPGDQIDGWQVDHVGPAEVVLSHLRQKVTLSLSQ